MALNIRTDAVLFRREGRLRGIAQRTRVNYDRSRATMEAVFRPAALQRENTKLIPGFI